MELHRVVDILDALYKGLVSPGEPHQAMDVSGQVHLEASVSIGGGSDDKTERPPRTSVRLSYLPYDSDKAKQVREAAGAAQYAQNVVVVVSFTVKDGVDVFSLGELTATFKSVLNDPQERTRFVTRGKVSKLPDGSKVYELIITVLPEPVFQKFSEVFEHYRPTQLDATLELSQSPGDRQTAAEFIEGKMSISAKLSKQIFMLLDVPSNHRQEAACMGQMRRLRFGVEFDEISEFYNSAFPDLPHKYRVLSWQTVTEYFKEPLAKYQVQVQEMDSSGVIVLAFLKKLQEYLHGIHAVSIIAGDHTLRMECDNLDLVRLIPQEEELKAVREVALKREEERKRKAQHMSTHSLIRVVMLGDGGVGKSSLVLRFVQGIFVQDIDPTYDDSYRKQVSIDGISTVLDILDTAYYDEFSAMRDQYMRSGQVFVLVYSIASRTSWKNIEQLVEQIVRVKDANSSKDVVCILCGTKCDVEDQREVMASEGQELADKIGCAFMETSAKTAVSVDACFESLVRAFRHKMEAEWAANQIIL